MPPSGRASSEPDGTSKKDGAFGKDLDSQKNLLTARAVASATRAAKIATTDPSYKEVDVPVCAAGDDTCRWREKARELTGVKEGEEIKGDFDNDLPDYQTEGLIPRDNLLVILRREEELRMCDGIQSLYDRFPFPPPDIELELQVLQKAQKQRN